MFFFVAKSKTKLMKQETSLTILNIVEPNFIELYYFILLQLFKINFTYIRLSFLILFNNTNK